VELRKVPNGWWSRDFRVTLDEQIVATAHYNLWGASGEVVVDGKSLSIRRRRAFDLEWFLSSTNGAQVAVAYRSGAGIILTWNDGTEIRMERVHPFTRRVRIIICGPLPGLITNIGEIMPHRLFSREATLDLAAPLPLEAQVCCLWLGRWVIMRRN